MVNWVSSVRSLHKPTSLEGFFAAAKVLTAMILFAFKTLLTLIIVNLPCFMSSCYWLKNEEFTACICKCKYISPFCGVKLHCIYYSIYLIITGTLFNVKRLYNCEHQAFSVRRLARCWPISIFALLFRYFIVS